MNDTLLVAIIGGLLGGSTIAAIINQIGESVRQKRKRKYEEEDKSDGNMSAVKIALKWVMYDRIRYLAHVYIKEGSVDFDDRRILHEMHKSYHNGLGGNGDLDTLMNQVDALPLKV